MGRMGVHFLMASDRLREHPSEAGVARRGTRLTPPNWTPAELQSLAGPPQGCPLAPSTEAGAFRGQQGHPGVGRKCAHGVWCFSS